MMIHAKVDHVAIWVEDLERAKSFYLKYFGLESTEKYVNVSKQFSSYFLSPSGGGCRIELMHRPGMVMPSDGRTGLLGYAHIALSVGSKEEVDRLTARIGADGFRIVGQPRTTGDGYYESVVEDTEGNLVEITV